MLLFHNRLLTFAISWHTQLKGTLAGTVRISMFVFWLISHGCQCFLWFPVRVFTFTQQWWGIMPVFLLSIPNRTYLAYAANTVINVIIFIRCWCQELYFMFLARVVCSWRMSSGLYGGCRFWLLIAKPFFQCTNYGKFMLFFWFPNTISVFQLLSIYCFCFLTCNLPFTCTYRRNNHGYMALCTVRFETFSFFQASFRFWCHFWCLVSWTCNVYRQSHRIRATCLFVNIWK